MALPTPRYEHLGPRGPFRDVYEPAEDTFLLLDALERDAGSLRQARYGTGAGIAATQGCQSRPRAPRGAAEVGKGLRGKQCQEGLRALGFFSMK